MKIYKPKFWDEKRVSFLLILLWPISLLYNFFFSIKKSLIKSNTFSVPIICVGNIYLGGTGKTPVCIKIYDMFKNNFKSVIIKKDYKKHYDEINLLKKYSKIILCKNRVEGIYKALNEKYNLLIFDDGYQDISIKKNLNIICFNSKQKIGNGQTLPAGPLREKLTSLKNCHIVMINGKKDLEFENQLKKYNFKVEIFYFQYQAEILDQFKNKKLIAFAGIGNPKNFFNTLKENHLNVVKEVSFPDHHSFTEVELENLLDMEKKYNAKLVTTEKDFCRISSINRRKFSIIPIKVNIEEEQNFFNTVKKYLK